MKIPDYSKKIKHPTYLEMQEEIEKLNNIIIKLEKWLNEQKDFLKEISFIQTLKEIKMEHKIMMNDYQNVLEKLQELKGVDKE